MILNEQIYHSFWLISKYLKQLCFCIVVVFNMDELIFYELINDDEFILIGNQFDIKNEQEEKAIRELSGEIVDKIINEILEEVIQEVYITKQPKNEMKFISDPIQMELKNEKGDTIINIEETNDNYNQCKHCKHCEYCKHKSFKNNEEYQTKVAKVLAVSTKLRKDLNNCTTIAQVQEFVEKYLEVDFGKNVAEVTPMRTLFKNI